MCVTSRVLLLSLSTPLSLQFHTSRLRKRVPTVNWHWTPLKQTQSPKHWCTPILLLQNYHSLEMVEIVYRLSCDLFNPILSRRQKRSLKDLSSSRRWIRCAGCGMLLCTLQKQTSTALETCSRELFRPFQLCEYWNHSNSKAIPAEWVLKPFE